MTQTNALRVLFGTFAVLITICLSVVGIAYGQSQARVAEQTNAQDSALYDCEVVEVGEASGHTEDYAALLRDAGWEGVDVDGAERLFSPACNVEVTQTSVTAWDIDGNAVFSVMVD